jgi:hypothetical protein
VVLIPSGGGFIPTSMHEWLNSQDVERLNRYREYLEFYEGDQWERRRRAGETRLTFNYARALVRKVASYVFPEPVVHSVREDAGGSDQQRELAEHLLHELNTEQNLHTLDFQTLVDASVLGDGCFKVIWSAAVGSPLVSSVDPSGLWAWSEPEDVRRVRRIVERYTLSTEDAERLFSIGVAVNDTRVPIVEDWTADTLRIEVAGQVIRDERNPYGRLPYILFPNFGKPHDLWGESDLQDLFDVCKELNRRMTVISRILQVSGNPIVVLENVTGSEGIRADEGAIWELPEDSKAYLLDMLGTGIDLHMRFVDQLYRALYDLAEVPQTAFGDSEHQMSGAALEVQIQPLVQKVQRKRRVWDSVYRRRNDLVLDLYERFGGQPLGGVRRTTPVWGSILPRDREALVRAESSLVSAGIRSRRQAMEQLGVEDPESEWLQILEEREQFGEDGDDGANDQPDE